LKDLSITSINEVILITPDNAQDQEDLRQISEKLYKNPVILRVKNARLREINEFDLCYSTIMAMALL
jgi:phosphoribosylformylglycinamidine (FGAM) synthase PurS component